jgi:arsenate reductase
MNRPRVLFLCTGNSARSQMAEAFLRYFAGDRFEVHSAGIEPRDINPFTFKVMEEIGLPLTGHTSKSVNVYLGKLLFQYLITVCDQAEEKCPSVWLGTTRHLHWSFEDPAAFQGTEEETLEKFREVRDQIERKVKEWIELEVGSPSTLPGT